MNKSELKTVLTEHGKWVIDHATGARADLHYADLRHANLSEANLSDANLSDADLTGANLRGANLRGADLRYANLCEANLCDADLTDAILHDANLREADLTGADLCGAVGIFSFGPMGENSRIGYAVQHKDGPMFALGCFWGNLQETRKAIVAKYGARSLYEKQIILAGKIVMEAK